MPGHEKLCQLVRETLNQLYNPVCLHSSPLVASFRLTERLNRADALQTLLIESIKELRPSARAPRTAKASRYYRVLHYRYVQQYTQTDVANKVGLSARHLRREQDAAISALVNLLHEKYLASEPDVSYHGNIAGRSGTFTDGSAGDGLRDGSADVAAVVSETSQLARGLAKEHGVALESHVGLGLPMAGIPRSVIKSVLLDLLNACIPAVAGGTLATEARAQGDQIQILLQARCEPTAGAFGCWDEAELSVSRHLIIQSGGQLMLSCRPGCLTAALALPRVVEQRVLAIEDNEDTLQLWTRYVENTPYRLIGIGDPGEALSAAVRHSPSVIVLDVMMPAIDGWEILGRLQYHPETREIPVIVCTIHPQRELAFSLGAADFLRKPTTRQSLLEALARQTAASAS